MDKLIDELIKFPIFSGMDGTEIQSVLQCIGYSIHEYKKGEFISLESDWVTWIGIPLDSSVQMVKEDIWGDKTILSFIPSGQIFGETFSCSQNPISTVSFFSVDSSRILFLPFRKVMISCGRSCVFHHKLTTNMVSLIAQKNYQLLERLEIISKKTLREKILAYLSQEAEQQKSKEFKIPLGRVEMAEYLGANRSALTRELNDMKKDGLIQFEKRQFTLLQSAEFCR